MVENTWPEYAVIIDHHLSLGNELAVEHRNGAWVATTVKAWEVKTIRTLARFFREHPVGARRAYFVYLKVPCFCAYCEMLFWQEVDGGAAQSTPHSGRSIPVFKGRTSQYLSDMLLLTGEALYIE